MPVKVVAFWSWSSSEVVRLNGVTHCVVAPGDGRVLPPQSGRGDLQSQFQLRPQADRETDAFYRWVVFRL